MCSHTPVSVQPSAPGQDGCGGPSQLGCAMAATTVAADYSEATMDLQKLGVFGFIDSLSGPEIKAFARKVERLGYSTLWFPEAFGRDPFALAAHILTVTERLTVGTGIANVWKREAVTTIGAARTLAELFPDRFVLGLGISHGPMMTQLGFTYAKPVSFMREYLSKLRSAPYTAPRPKSDPPLVLAALLP